MDTIWKRLKAQLNKPLSGFQKAAIPITGNIFQIEDAYVLTSNHYPDLSPASEPIVGFVIWAPSQGAVLRAFKMNIEADDGVDGEIPIDMRIAEHAITFESIRSIGREQGIKFMESGEYRIMADGAFVHRQLESRFYRAYFRSPYDQPDEKPYAIAVKA